MRREFNVFTLNCWGIAHISKDKQPRMEAIADYLSRSNYDFVFLQEVWTTSDYEFIRERTKDVLPYSHYFHSGVVGGGICIFSKPLIEDVFFYPWSLNGYAHKVMHADWFAGKGVGMCYVKFQDLRVLLTTAHLHAEYNRDNDEYKAHRLIQALEMSQLIRFCRKRVDLCIVAGDFNTEHIDLPYQIIRHNTGLKDAFLETDQMEANGSTCYNPRNSYTPSSELNVNPDGKRIDYIMYSCRSDWSVKTSRCDTPLPSRVPVQSFSYSDHEAVAATFLVTDEGFTIENNFGAKTKCLQDGLELCEGALRDIRKRKQFFLFIMIIMLLLLVALPSGVIAYWLHYLIVITRVGLTLATGFSAFMLLIWYRMEKHALLAGILTMETRLSALQAFQLDFEPS